MNQPGESTSRFAAWLYKARKAAKLTYVQLAELSGVSTATIHGLEHGQSSPTLETVEKLCKALGTSVEAALRVRSSKPVNPSLIACAEQRADKVL